MYLPIRYSGIMKGDSFFYKFAVKKNCDMGKGDKKSKRGKIILGSYGRTRPKKKKNTFVKAVEPKKEKAAPEIRTGS